jgi:peptidoglycan/LPS O-acetylase OafA/YrhL
VNILDFFLPVVMLTLGSVLVERSGSLRFPRFAIRLGDASYSIYLIHVLVVVPAVSRLAKAGITSALGIWGAFIAFAAILVGLGFYGLVERPLHQWSRTWVNRVFQRVARGNGR